MTSSLTSRRASSSSSSAHQWTYDVFLSFSREDGGDFTSDLYDFLERRGINTYIDDEQPRSGENISSMVLKAIEESRILVVVLSEKYATSLWCSNKLQKILEYKTRKGQIVLPVYYMVNRSDVRYQSNSLRLPVPRPHWCQVDFQREKAAFQRWKAALSEVASLSGWHLRSPRNQDQCIDEIVHQIANLIYSQVAKHPVGPVGIESPVQVPDLSSSPSPVGIESPVQVPDLSSSPSPVGTESLVQVSDLFSSPSPVGTESLVQVPNLSSSPSGNGEQGSNSSISSYIPFLFLIGSMIGLLQLHDLFETHPVNMWITEAALVIFCLSHAVKKKINETHRARYSHIIDGFRVLTGTLIVASLSSIPLSHRLWWLFFVVWTLHAFIVVVDGMKVERGQTLPLIRSRIPPTIHSRIPPTIHSRIPPTPVENIHTPSFLAWLPILNYS